MDLDFAQSWDAYLRATPIWPTTPPGGPAAPVRVRSLRDIAEAADVFVMDGYGVLNLFDDPVPGMDRVVAEMQAMGKEFFILSNGASYATARTASKYREMGYRFDDSRIISSWDLARDHMRAHIPDGQSWQVIAPTDSEYPTLHPNLHLLDGDAVPDEAADGFLFMSSHDWTGDRQDRLLRALEARPRPLVVANPDVVAPYPDRAVVQPGYWGMEVWHATGIEPVFTGKPFDNAYDTINGVIARDLGAVEPSRIMMVGDTPFTDILGGARAGYRTALMTDFGFFKGVANVDGRLAECGIVPDFIISEH